MIIDLTTKVKEELVEPWLAKQEKKHIALGHVGTHLDTYLKSEIPLEYFKTRGVLIDASSYSEKREIDVKDVKKYEIKKGDFVLFRTDRINKTYGTVEYFKDHPELSQDLIKYLAKKEVAFIGIDAAGIRREKEHTPADKYCEEKNVYVIENLCNLDKINFDEMNIYTMWLEDKETTGLRCRVIAEKRD